MWCFDKSITRKNEFYLHGPAGLCYGAKYKCMVRGVAALDWCCLPKQVAVCVHLPLPTGKRDCFRLPSSWPSCTQPCKLRHHHSPDMQDTDLLSLEWEPRRNGKNRATRPVYFGYATATVSHHKESPYKRV